MELYAEAVDFRTAGFHPLKWTAAFDNPHNSQPIAAVPAGIGLAVAFDGSSEAITTTEAGTWALTLGMSIPGDATWIGQVELDPNNADPAAFMYLQALGGASNRATISEVVTYPVGVVIAPMVVTATQSTTNPFAGDGLLVIVRLA